LCCRTCLRLLSVTQAAESANQTKRRKMYNEEKRREKGKKVRGSCTEEQRDAEAIEVGACLRLCLEVVRLVMLASVYFRGGNGTNFNPGRSRGDGCETSHFFTIVYGRLF